MRAFRTVFLLILPWALGGCNLTQPAASPQTILPPAPKVEILENGLGADRDTFYHTAEGSEIFPRVYLEAAETREAQPRPFLATLEDYGFIRDDQPGDPKLKSLGYIGLTISNKDGVDLVGVNCAACHVGQIETADGKRIRIDGAPNMFDIISFFNGITRTKPNMDKLGVGIVADLKGRKLADLESPKTVAANLDKYFSHLSSMAPLANGTTSMAGRADAFGAARAVFFGDAQPLSAPTSFPSLWGFQKSAWFHWNANTDSAFERNIGQSIGLGADFDPRTCKTDIIFDSLDKMEKLAYKIQPPAWPEQFLGTIDRDAARAGKAIYMKECAKCHDNYDDVDNTAGHSRHNYRLFSIAAVGTDPYEAMGAIKPVEVDKNMCLPGQPEQKTTMTFADAHGMFIGRVRDAFFAANPEAKKHAEDWGDHRGDAKWVDRVRCEGKDPRGCPVYPAKPLVGIWASPPYLHNGSVPSMMDLLTSAKDRPDHFLVGQRRYDPKSMGYDQKAGQGHVLNLRDSVGNFYPGDSNAGHEYGTTLTETEKLQLIEFLKSLKACTADDKAKAAAGSDPCYDQDQLRQEFEMLRKAGK